MNKSKQCPKLINWNTNKKGECKRLFKCILSDDYNIENCVDTRRYDWNKESTTSTIKEILNERRNT